MKTRPLLALAALAVLPACGHKGDPLPPLRRTPPAPSGFRFAQRGDVLELVATAPAASVDGVAFDRLALEFLYGTGEVDLEKRGQKRLAQGVPGQRIGATLPLPAPGTVLRAAVRGVSSGERGARTVTKALVVQAPLEPPRELQSVADDDGVRLTWHGVLPKAVEPPPAGPQLPGSPPARSPGSPPAAPPSPGAAPAAPAAAAPAATAEPRAGTPVTPGETPPSSSTPGPAGAPAVKGSPAAPSAVAPGGTPSTGAGASAAPPAAAPPARRNGFFVYRRMGQGGYAEPLGGEPLESLNAVDADVPLGERACYVVRAVASTDPLIESAPSNETCVERRDTRAPATPAGLAILPRSGGLEVLWSPSGEADLTGYRVYREAPGQPRRRLTEVGMDKAAYVDETAAKGTTYLYSVTAFDQSGNESEPTDPVEGSLP